MKGDCRRAAEERVLQFCRQSLFLQGGSDEDYYFSGQKNEDRTGTFFRLQQTAFPFGGGAAEKMDAGKDAGRAAAPVVLQ